VKFPFFDLRAADAPMRSELAEAMQRVLDGGWFVLGPELEAFETEFAAWCGAAHCVGVGNGLDALTLTLRALGVGPGDEVVVPAHTFIATWLAVSQAGATPVPADVDEATCNLDPAAFERAITPRTRAVVVVHLYGCPAEMAPITEIARRRGIRVVEDAAQAHGATLRGRRAGTLGDAAAFSFYPTKNLGALGDGGAVTTADPAVAERVRLLRNYGSRVKYRHETQGVNSRLDELQAALLRVKLRHLDAANARRRVLAARYLAGLADVRGLRLPATPADADPVWHLLTVRHEQRDALQSRLTAAGVGTLIHYPVPVHLSEAYASLGHRPGSFPVSERISRTVLSLPFGPYLTDADVAALTAAVRGAAQGL
jgi:dTDP-4-amino-4,6-dideoxygalactose transaminase